MKCYICNKDIEAPEWDSLHKDWAPCGECKAIIADVFPAAKEEGEDEDDDHGF